ncbi:MAG: hypothetical protein FJW40_21425 [Acidobacteria bacterium]|nr:hypothetical protein [Acidobacteriota bacterium]
MYSSDDILEAARTIRPYLPSLIGPPAAAVLDAKLASLLADARQGRKVDNLILDALQAPEAREWTRQFLRAGALETLRAYQPVAGPGRPVAAEKYCCPQGDYVWYRRQVGETVPKCPTHQCELTQCELTAC